MSNLASRSVRSLALSLSLVACSSTPNAGATVDASTNDVATSEVATTEVDNGDVSDFEAAEREAATAHDSATPEVEPIDAATPGRTIHFVNKCAATIWVGALTGDKKYPLPENGGWALAAGGAHSIRLPVEWGGRFWGRTACVFDAAGKGACATGDCGAKLECAGAGGNPPASLAEFQFAGFGGKDFYDVSLVDGYNLPLAVAPSAGTVTFDPSKPYGCGAPTCTNDLNASCPTELQQLDGAGHVVACLSACEKFHTDEYCCAGAHNTPATCPPSDYSKAFKAACPGAYSYAYDDKTSTFTCAGSDYDVTFCP